jgi:branched-chain amino acid transport system permease protein
MEHFVQLIVIGLELGAIYALIALGYTMVYGVLGLINFAHGDVYMVGAYFSFFSVQYLYSHTHAQPSWGMFFLALLISLVGCGVLGSIIERFAYRPLRNAPRLACLITAVGVSLLLENAGNLSFVFGSESRTSLDVLPGGHVTYNFSGVIVDRNYLVLFGCTLLLLAVLWWVVSKTRWGRAMRAVSFDRDAASLMGVDINKVIGVTFFVGSALAGAAGCLFATLTQNPLNPYMGILPGMKAFVAAVIGGIGNIPGAAVGGFIMGLVESLVIAYGGVIHLPSSYSDAISFAILIVILLVRPTGMFGKSLVEKV